MVRRLARTVPRGLRRRLLRDGPVITVVVTATDLQEPFLDECLDSLRGQQHTALDVVVVPHGPAAGVLRVAARHVAADWRVRVLPVATDQAAGRDAGAAAAVGELLAFVEASDALPPHGLGVLAGSLAASGSQLAVGDWTQAAPNRHLVRSEHRSAHTRTTLAADLVTRPEALRDLGVGNRLFSRAFWQAQRLRFTGSLPDALMAEAYVRAGRFDLRREVTYHALQRGDGRSFGTLEPAIPDLGPWLAAQRRILADPDRSGGYLVGLLDSMLVRFLDDAERADEEQWRALAGFAADCLDRGGPGVLDRVRALPRAKAWLAAHGRRADLEDLVAAGWYDEGFPTEVVDGRVLATLPVTGLPEEVRRLADPEVQLVAGLRGLRWEGDRVRLSIGARIDGVDLVEAPDVEVALVDGGGRAPCPDVAVGTDLALTREAGQRHHDYDHGLVDVLLPALAPGGRSVEVTLSVHGVRRTGPVGSILPGSSAGAPRERADGRGSVTARVVDDPDGPRVLLETRDTASRRDAAVRIEDLALDGEHLRVRVSGAADTVRLVGPGVDAAPDRAEPVDGTTVLWFLLRDDPWGLGSRPLPSGRFALGADGHRVDVADALLDRLPLEDRGTHHRAEVTRSPDGAVVRLGPLLADDERGPRAQAVLRSWYDEIRDPVDPGLVYLQSYPGESATDSQLEIFHELRRTRPGLTVRWGVADTSKWVPEGAEPVLIGSREHYRVMATAGVICCNIELDGWFRPRTGQRYLQTFHGYPAKAMGIPQWQAKGFTPRRVSVQLDQTARAWSAALTPTEEMDRLYREAYDYDGECWHLGYPRNDPLVAGDVAEVRARTRALLGIPEDATVVLYAPTWRDDLATAWRAARTTTDFDVHEVAAALGDGFVVLARGHRFHATTGTRCGNVVDVTSYPQVNDLVLAADAAVLDYSSLRFDFALTGRPMVFHVPDLASYTGGVRGFLLDFRETAPGPLLDTWEQVVEALRRLPDTAAQHAAELAAFNERFNPLHDGHAAERVVQRLYDS